MTASALSNFREEMYLWSHRDGECRQVLRDPCYMWYMRRWTVSVSYMHAPEYDSGSRAHKERRSLCDAVQSSTMIAQRLASYETTTAGQLE